MATVCMDRAVFSCSSKPSSFSLSLPSPRGPTRFISASDSENSSSRARFLIEHFERHSPQHLQIACLAVSESHELHQWPKEDRCFSAAASLLGLLNAVAVCSPTLCSLRGKVRSCQFATGDGLFSVSSAASNESNESGYKNRAASHESNESSSGNKETEDTWLDINGMGSVKPVSDNNCESLDRGLLVGNSSPLSWSGHGGTRAEQAKPNDSRASSLDVASIPVKEPIYEVLEVKPSGTVVTKTVSRRLLLKTSGLRLRDIRSVDPSLWVTNSAPALLIRDQAILLNLGSLRAIASAESVLLFDHRSVGAAAFLELLLQRLSPESNSSVPAMPFELEVVEAALLSRTQGLERRLMEVEPRVVSLLEVLPNCLTANVLEELRLSKQALVELGSKSGALRQMLLELLESPQEIRRMTIMGRQCSISKKDGSVQCMASSDKQSADDEEEEMEMLLDNYLQRCESCHGQAERLLDSAKEMEDSIAVNLSSRRLEVSRLELLLQVGTFCSALGALVAGVFGMNLRSYLEGSAFAFWLTSAGIVVGGIILFFVMYNHLRQRKIL